MEGGYDENGSKRSQTRRLSRRYVFFKFPYYTKVNFYCIYRTITSTINDNEKSRQCPTQRLTSNRENFISDISSHDSRVPKFRDSYMPRGAMALTNKYEEVPTIDPRSSSFYSRNWNFIMR